MAETWDSSSVSFQTSDGDFLFVEGGRRLRVPSAEETFHDHLTPTPTPTPTPHVGVGSDKLGSQDFQLVRSLNRPLEQFISKHPG